MAGFGGNANNYQAPESRALSSIAKSPGPDVNTDFVKMISQHDAQIKFLADQVKQTQKGVSEANQNPIQQIQQFIADLTVLLGGGELPKGALEFGDLQYILPAIGALFGFGDGGFPVNLFAAAEKFFLGYVVPSEQYNDLTIAAINSWGEQLGIDPQFLRDLSALVRAFGDLFSAVQDLLNACGHFISMLFTPDGVDYGPLGMILQPIVSFLGFGWLDLSKVGDAVSWITDGLDPGIRKLVATVNSITTMIVSLAGAIEHAETDMVGYAHDQGSALDNAFAQVLQWIGNALGIPGSNAPKVEGIEHAPAISADVAAWTIDDDPDNGWSFDGSTTYAGNGGSFFTNGNGITKRLLTQDRLPCFAGQRLTVNDYFQWSNIPHDADAGACVVFYTGSTEIGQTNLPLPNDADSADWAQVGGSVTVPADADGFAVGVYVGANVTSGTVRVGQISTRNWTWINQRQTTAFISYFQNLGHVFDGVDWTSSNALSQMWQGIVNTWIQPIAGWLTPDSPINAANLVGNLFPDGLPMSWLTSTPRNELDNADFRTAISLVGGTTWRWTDGIYFADSTSTGSACTTADGTDRALRSNPIDVVAGKSVSMSVEVLADDLTGTGNPVQLWAVPDVGDPVLLESAFPSGGDSGWHDAPIGSKSVTLNGSYTPTAGVSTVQMRFAVTADATSGDVYFDHAKAWIVGGWLEQIWDQTTDIFAAFANADTQEEFAAAWDLVLDLFELPHPENFWTWLVNSFIAPLFGLDSQTAAEIGDDIDELLSDAQAKNDAWQTFLQACWDALTSSDTFSQKVAAIQTAWNAFAEVVGDIQADETLTLQNILNQLFHLDATGKIDISWLAGLLPQNQVDGLQTDLNQITSAQTTANTAFQNLLNGFAEALTGADLNGDADVETWTSAWDQFTGVLAGTQQAQNNAWQDIWNRLWGLNSDGTVKTTSIPFFDDVRKFINQMVAPLHWGYFDTNWAWVAELNTPSSQLPGSDPVFTPGNNDGDGDAISSQFDSTIPPPPTGLVAVPIPFTMENFPAGKITYAIAAVKDGIEGPTTKVSVRMDTLFPPNCSGQVNLAWDAMSGYTFKIYRQVDATYQATDWHLVGSPSTAGTWLSPYQDTTVRTGGTVAHPKTDAELSAQIVTDVKSTGDTISSNLYGVTDPPAGGLVASSAVGTPVAGDANLGDSVAKQSTNHQNLLDAVAVGATGDGTLSDVALSTTQGSVDGLRQSVVDTADTVSQIVAQLNGTPQSAGLNPIPSNRTSSTSSTAWGPDWTFYPSPSNVTGRASSVSGWYIGSESGSSSQGFGLLNQQLLTSDDQVPTTATVSAGVDSLPSAMFGETGNSVILIGGAVANTLTDYYLYARLFSSKIEIGYGKGFARTPLATANMSTGSASAPSLIWKPGSIAGRWTISASTSPGRGVGIENATLPFTPGAFMGAGITAGTSGYPPHIRSFSAYTIEATSVPGVGGRYLSTATLSFGSSGIAIIPWSIPTADSQFASTTGPGGVTNGGIVFNNAGIYMVQLDVPFTSAPDNDTHIDSLYYLNNVQTIDYCQQQGSYSALDGRTRFRFTHLIPVAAGMSVAFGIRPNKALSSDKAVISIGRFGILG